MSLFRTNETNPTIAVDGIGVSYFSSLAIEGVFDKGLTKTGNGNARGVARYRYTKSGERIDNITDWGLNKFIAQYGKKGVTKDTIFAYCYAVLHDPLYREKYALNLKREFPRIPFYPDFAQWAAWGEALMALHIGYEDVAPWPVKRVETAARQWRLPMPCVRLNGRSRQRRRTLNITPVPGLGSNGAGTRQSASIDPQWKSGHSAKDLTVAIC